jgi:hypothetical protein
MDMKKQQQEILDRPPRRGSDFYEVFAFGVFFGAAGLYLFIEIFGG